MRIGNYRLRLIIAMWCFGLFLISSLSSSSTYAFQPNFGLRKTAQMIFSSSSSSLLLTTRTYTTETTENNNNEDCFDDDNDQDGISSLQCGTTFINVDQSMMMTKKSNDKNKQEGNKNRRSFLTSNTARLLMGFTTATSITGTSSAVYAAETEDTNNEEESFASIAARASKLSSDTNDQRAYASITSTGSNSNTSSGSGSGGNSGGDTRTAYDFELPVSGISIPFKELIHQEINNETGMYSKVKVILVSNMKEDDPVARKDIPEFISLATKYGRDGEFAVILSPTDQGYYEPDTSQLVRLKLASEYGYGINPSTVLTDKVNMLGKTALPFWRWLQSNCRTPAGLGRVEGNFEKFLIDGRTGLPLRRYPRKYKPTNIKNDIEAILAGRPLPPAGANFKEEWRAAAVEAEQGTYRFQKGLNYYD